MLFKFLFLNDTFGIEQSGKKMDWVFFIPPKCKKGLWFKSILFPLFRR